VRSINFLPVDADTTRNLILELEIDERMRDQVRSDSRAVIRTLGLLGDRALDISSGTPGARILESGDTLEASAVLDYDRLLFRAAGAVEDVVALTGDLRIITAGLAGGEGTLGLLLRDRQLYDGLAAALRNSNSLLVRVRESNGTFSRLLDDSTLYGQMVGAVAVVDSAARLFASDKGTVGRLLSDSSVYLSLSRAAGTADSLLQGVRDGRGTAGKLLTDDSLYEMLLRSVADLTAVLDDFRKNPARYTRGMIRIF
jgi:phospholipid/cholesterol/gamma-HCH transport system substrate-binding protein